MISVGSPPRVSSRVTPLSIAWIAATSSEAFHSDHTGMRQMTPDSLSGQRLPASLQAPLLRVIIFI